MLEYLHYAGAGQIQVVAEVAVRAVGEALQREHEDERAVDAFGVEDFQQLAQVGGLSGLVADVLALQANRRSGGSVELDHLQEARAHVASAGEGGRPKFGDRDRFALSDETTKTLDKL